MYESPIMLNFVDSFEVEDFDPQDSFVDKIYKDVTEKADAYIMSRVNLVVDVDKDELLKALRYDRDQYEKGYAEGRQARENDIVRCKDCKWFETPYWCHNIGAMMEPNGFCSLAERRDDGSSAG